MSQKRVFALFWWWSQSCLSAKLVIPRNISILHCLKYMLKNFKPALAPRSSCKKGFGYRGCVEQLVQTTPSLKNDPLQLLLYLYLFV